MDLYVSPHGNHVLAKLIEVLPSSRLVCIAESMKGQAATVARRPGQGALARPRGSVPKH